MDDEDRTNSDEDIDCFSTKRLVLLLTQECDFSLLLVGVDWDDGSVICCAAGEGRIRLTTKTGLSSTYR